MYADCRFSREHLRTEHSTKRRCLNCRKRFSRGQERAAMELTNHRISGCEWKAETMSDPELMTDAQEHLFTQSFIKSNITPKRKWECIFQFLFPGDPMESPCKS